MQSAKEKLRDIARAAKQHMDVCEAKIDVKAEMAVARTEEEKVIARELPKANEAKAKMELHAAEKLSTKQAHLYGHHETPPAGYLPTSPLAENLPSNHRTKT